jgi:HYPK UBA domain
MTTTKDEAKQLDSVTDRVQDKEFDATLAKDAMSALTTLNDPSPLRGMDSDTNKIGSNNKNNHDNQDGSNISNIEINDNRNISSPSIPQKTVILSKEDVEFLVNEMEITKGEAEKALRDALLEVQGQESNEDFSPLYLALRKVVTSCDSYRREFQI